MENNEPKVELTASKLHNIVEIIMWLFEHPANIAKTRLVIDWDKNTNKSLSAVTDRLHGILGAELTAELKQLIEDNEEAKTVEELKAIIRKLNEKLSDAESSISSAVSTLEDIDCEEEDYR